MKNINELLSLILKFSFLNFVTSYKLVFKILPNARYPLQPKCQCLCFKTVVKWVDHQSITPEKQGIILKKLQIIFHY